MRGVPISTTFPTGVRFPHCDGSRPGEEIAFNLCTAIGGRSGRSVDTPFGVPGPFGALSVRVWPAPTPDTASRN